jgi:hypothetical protein
MPTITYTERLSTTRCWCGIPLAVPENLLDQAYNHGVQIHCPIGHRFGWKETEADRQKARADRAEANLKRARDRAEAEKDLREDTERRLRAQKGETTKARKRAAAAVCPCCNRSFVQLRRHMETKHPDYQPTSTP